MRVRARHELSLGNDALRGGQHISQMTASEWQTGLAYSKPDSDIRAIGTQLKVALPVATAHRITSMRSVFWQST
jgi:hypothetical protein